MREGRIVEEAPFTLYGHYESGNVYKAALCLALAGRDFSYRHVDIFAGEQRVPEFQNVSRFREVPALVHGPRRLVQSGVILSYLAKTLGTFGGHDEEACWRIQEWLFWDNHRMLPSLALLRYQLRWVPDCEDAVIAFCRVRAEAALSKLDQALQGQDFLVGEAVTIADIACSGYVWFIDQANLDIASWPAVAAWLDRISAV